MDLQGTGEYPDHPVEEEVRPVEDEVQAVEQDYFESVQQLDEEVGEHGPPPSLSLWSGPRGSKVREGVN